MAALAGSHGSFGPFKNLSRRARAFTYLKGKRGMTGTVFDRWSYTFMTAGRVLVDSKALAPQRQEKLSDEELRPPRAPKERGPCPAFGIHLCPPRVMRVIFP